MARLNIPVGVSDFEKIQKNGYYYIDKSSLITEVLKKEVTGVTLLTRPRRFGKTLAMSMLASFLISESRVRSYLEDWRFLPILIYVKNG